MLELGDSVGLAPHAHDVGVVDLLGGGGNSEADVWQALKLALCRCDPQPNALSWAGRGNRGGTVWSDSVPSFAKLAPRCLHARGKESRRCGEHLCSLDRRGGQRVSAPARTDKTARRTITRHGQLTAVDRRGGLEPSARVACTRFQNPPARARDGSRRGVGRLDVAYGLVNTLVVTCWNTLWLMLAVACPPTPSQIP